MSQNKPVEWMVVYTAYSAPEAHIVAGRLRSEDIYAHVHQEPLGSALGITVGPLGEVKVLVRAEDYERALELLEADAPDLLPDDVDRVIYDDTDPDNDPE